VISAEEAGRLCVKSLWCARFDCDDDLARGQGLMGDLARLGVGVDGPACPLYGGPACEGQEPEGVCGQAG
jgi:hypothetical protein